MCTDFQEGGLPQLAESTRGHLSIPSFQPEDIIIMSKSRKRISRNLGDLSGTNGDFRMKEGEELHQSHGRGHPQGTGHLWGNLRLGYSLAAAPGTLLS